MKGLGPLFIFGISCLFAGVANAGEMPHPDPFIAVSDRYHSNQSPEVVRQEGQLALELHFQTQQPPEVILRDYQNYAEEQRWEHRILSDPQLGIYALEANADDLEKKVVIAPVDLGSNESYVAVTSNLPERAGTSQYPDLLKESDVLGDLFKDASFDRTIYHQQGSSATFMTETVGSPRSVIRRVSSDLYGEGWRPLLDPEMELNDPQNEQLMMFSKGNSHLMLYASREEGETSLVAQIQEQN